MPRRPREPRRCVYCGKPLRPRKATNGPDACAEHRDLIASDPEFGQARGVAKDAPDAYAPLRKRHS